MKKLGILVLLGMVLMTLVACGPVKPAKEGSAEDVTKAGAFLTEAMGALTTEDYDTEKSNSKTKNEVTTSTGSIDGAKTQVEWKFEIDASGDKTILNGEVEVRYDAKTATVVFENVGDKDGEVWYFHSADGDFYIKDAALVEEFTQLLWRLF